MRSICIPASRKSQLPGSAAPSPLSETAASGRSSSRDGLNPRSTRPPSPDGCWEVREPALPGSAPGAIIRREADKYLLGSGFGGEKMEKKRGENICREHLAFPEQERACRQANSHQHRHQ